MGQNGTKAAAQTASRTLKYPSSAPAASPVAPSPESVSAPPPAAAPRSTSSFQSQLSQLKSQQQRSFEDDGCANKVDDEYDPTKQQDSLSDAKKKALMDLLGSNTLRDSKIDASRVRFSEVVASESPVDTSSTPSPHDHIVHRFGTDGKHSAIDPDEEFIKQLERDASKAKATAVASKPEFETAAAAAQRTSSRFPLMDAKQQAEQELKLKDEVLDQRLSSISDNIVTAGGASEQRPVEDREPAPKYGFHPGSNASRRPLPQKQALGDIDNPEKSRVPPGKLNTVMLLQLMVTQKQPRSTWDLKALSQRFKISEQSVERMLTGFTLPWLWFDGKKLGAYKQQPDSASAVLLGEELLKNKSHHKLYKESKNAESGLGGAF
jgi:hypothetical protein